MQAWGPRARSGPQPLCSTFMASRIKMLQYRSGLVKLNPSFFKNVWRHYTHILAWLYSRLEQEVSCPLSIGHVSSIWPQSLLPLTNQVENSTISRFFFPFSWPTHLMLPSCCYKALGLANSDLEVPVTLEKRLGSAPDGGGGASGK